MASPRDTAYIVFDTESVVDGALLSRVLYPGEQLSASEALERYEDENRKPDGTAPFVPVTFHVPVAIAVARVDRGFRLSEVACLDAPGFEPQKMVELFWRGVQVYSSAALVDFNGRGFDLPLLTLAAFRFGLSCPRYFKDDRYGFRYRFTEKHIDLMEWMTEYGSYRMTGGLNLLAKMLGKPGKMDTRGDHVDELYSQGKLKEINDYCLHDTLDTYFVFLRTRVLTGELSIEEEQEIVGATESWLRERSEEMPALTKYLEAFGRWVAEPFV